VVEWEAVPVVVLYVLDRGGNVVDNHLHPIPNPSHRTHPSPDHKLNLTSTQATHLDQLNRTSTNVTDLDEDVEGAEGVTGVDAVAGAGEGAEEGGAIGVDATLMEMREAIRESECKGSLFSQVPTSFRLSALGFRVSGLRFTVYGLRFTVYGLRFTVYGLGTPWPSFTLDPPHPP
jgi:hypothetical protein